MKLSAYISVMLLAFAAVLPGCTSIYFYETEKVGLVLEARPDATAPITGTFGARRRVVALVPSTDGNDGRTAPIAENAALLKVQEASVAYSAALNEPVRNEAVLKDRHKALQDAIRNYDLARRGPDGDAMSLLNTFRFHKHPRAPSELFGRVEIDTALITGLAAIDVAGQPATSLSAMEAMTGASIGESSYTLAAIELAHQRLEELAKDGDPRAKELDADLDALGHLVPSQFKFALYSEFRGLPRQLRAKGSTTAGAYPAGGFTNLITYVNELRQSRTTIRDAIAGKQDNDQVILDGGATRSVSELKEDRFHADEELTRLENVMNRSEPLPAALKYIFGL